MSIPAFIVTLESHTKFMAFINLLVEHFDCKSAESKYLKFNSSQSVFPFVVKLLRSNVSVLFNSI